MSRHFAIIRLPGLSLALLLLVSDGKTQQPDPAPVPVGQGSYAPYPPAAAGPKVIEFATRKPINVAPDEKRPIPTNDWWSDLLVNKSGSTLWAYPVALKTELTGFAFYFPTRWVGQDMQTDFPIRVGGADFQPEGAIAKDWSDWTLVLGMADGPKRMDVTLGHGFPMAWAEITGFSPQLRLEEEATFFDDAGKAVAFPLTADHFGIRYHGRHYGVFAPAGTTFSLQGNTITLAVPEGTRSYLVLAALTAAEDLSYFYPYAYAIPRDTKVSWKYQPDAGQVAVTWNVTTQNLKGEDQKQVIQGFIPHHYKRTLKGMAFNGKEYAVPRGKMKCAVGNTFTFAYRFNGVLPHLPAPQVQDLPNPYRPERMRQMLADYAKVRKTYGDDTYWGAKDPHKFATYALMAKETKDPSFDTLKAAGHKALADWLTYTPGEDKHYFARYERWKALIGFRPSFGSEQFTDNHFHYGYFTHAGALQAMIDPEFLRGYGGMLKLVAKQYANWDRADTSFPFLRTFDPWGGHSYAGGMGSAGGNNQESTSEAVQSWAGVFLLGSMLGDDAMRDAGAFGYLSETRATMEYWFDWDRANLPPSYGHSMVGVLWDGGMVYGTYFSAAPQHIHGIQWLPISPALHYLAENQAYAAADYALMRKETKAAEESEYGADWANVALSYAQLFDPNYAARKFDQYWDAGLDAARKPDTGGLTYYYTHAHRSLGDIQWDHHMSIPTSTTYYNPRTKRYTYVVYNPKETEETCVIYKDGVRKGSFNVPARTLLAGHLDQKLTALAIQAPRKTVQPGQTVQLKAVGYDQYGATFPVGKVEWSIEDRGGQAAGAVSPEGLFTARANGAPVVVAAASASVVGRLSLRVGPAPVLSALTLTPPAARIYRGQQQQFTAAGRDQYGEEFPLEGPVWAAAGGTINREGLFTATEAGQGTVSARAGALRGSAAVVVDPPLTNLALNKPAEASSQVRENTAAAAVDGQVKTRWESEPADPQWLCVDLLRPSDLKRVVIKWEAASAKAYQVQVSADKEHWTTLHTEDNGGGGEEDLAVWGTGRYVRVYGTRRNTMYGYSILELEVYGLPHQDGPAPTAVTGNAPAGPAGTAVTGGTQPTGESKGAPAAQPFPWPYVLGGTGLVLAAGLGLAVLMLAKRRGRQEKKHLADRKPRK